MLKKNKLYFGKFIMSFTLSGTKIINRKTSYGLACKQVLVFWYLNRIFYNHSKKFEILSRLREI